MKLVQLCTGSWEESAYKFSTAQWKAFFDAFITVQIERVNFDWNIVSVAYFSKASLSHIP